MLHAIGRQRRKDEDLVDALLACHGRIRDFLALATRLSERADMARIDVSEGCARLTRYFSGAFPLHVADEELSLRPRLIGRSHSLDAALARMDEQHELHEGMIQRLCTSADALRVEPRAPRFRDALGAVGKPLAVVLNDHLIAEEQIIFPAVRALSNLEQQQIRVELAARRGLAAERYA